MSITFLIPVFNEVKTVKKAIEETINFNVPNKEIIIIDNGSTDETLSIINSIQDDRVEVHSMPHTESLGASLNRALNLKARGILEGGKQADINIFNLDKLEERMPELVHDFPFGASRFIQRAVGYKATLVNGKIILEDDELTGLRAGNVLRSYN